VLIRLTGVFSSSGTQTVRDGQRSPGSDDLTVQLRLQGRRSDEPVLQASLLPIPYIHGL
jgi:hypothetical protein